MKGGLIAENGKIGNDEWAFLNAPDRPCDPFLSPFGPVNLRANTMMSRILKCSAPFAVVAILIATPVHAASFDGPWSVTIVTQAGNCDAAYAFPMQVVGGRGDRLGRHRDAGPGEWRRGGQCLAHAGRLERPGQRTIIRNVRLRPLEWPPSRVEMLRAVGSDAAVSLSTN